MRWKHSQTITTITNKEIWGFLEIWLCQHILLMIYLIAIAIDMNLCIVITMVESTKLEISSKWETLDNENGEDYIFLDYYSDIPKLRDNDADYQTMIEISVLTKDFEDRKILVEYIKQKFLSTPTYSRSDEYEYYQAQFQTGVFIVNE